MASGWKEHEQNELSLTIESLSRVRDAHTDLHCTSVVLKKQIPSSSKLETKFYQCLYVTWACSKHRSVPWVLGMITCKISQYIIFSFAVMEKRGINNCKNLYVTVKSCFFFHETWRCYSIGNIQIFLLRNPPPFPFLELI